ncbi:hypothetical protein BOX15_Mlig020482g3, partial [Macrostomum lignano]
SQNQNAILMTEAKTSIKVRQITRPSMNNRGDKHILYALLLVCLVASLSLSQSVASALICQLNTQLSEEQLCQSVLVTSFCTAVATVAGVALQVVTASSIRRRNSLNQVNSASIRWYIGAICLSISTIALAITSLVTTLLLGLDYTSMQIHQLLLDNNVTRVPLLAGDALIVRQHNCLDPLSLAKKASTASSILFSGFDVALFEKTKDACPGESAAFMRLQLNVIAFNACLVTVLLLAGVRQAALAWMQMLLPWIQPHQQQQQQVEQLNLQEMAPMVANMPAIASNTV